MMSAMSFYSPTVLMDVRREACAACMIMPRKWRRRLDAREEPDFILIFNHTDEVLSQKGDA